MKVVALLVLAALSITLLSAASCKSQPANVNLGQEFQLKPGEKVSVDHENVILEFVGVTQDSRCPAGAVCIQAGQVVCIIHLIRSCTIYEASLTESGGSQQAEQTVLGYSLTFNVIPYPEVGHDILSGNYRLFLKMTKSV